jgi:hypothetical protein
MSDILPGLPLVERAKRYREVAAETEAWAARARSALGGACALCGRTRRLQKTRQNLA